SAAIQALGQALIFTSNLFAGLWNGIKQLSGGLLAIPGGIAMIGAAAGTLIPILSNLKNSLKEVFKDAGKDPAKVAEDIAALPPYMRDLAQTLVDLLPKWKDFQNILTATFISGAANQIKAFAGGILPNLASGADNVANSWRIAADQVMNFIGSAKTMSAIQGIFQNTAQTMNIFSSQIEGVGGGLRDIATVGATFLRNMAEDYLPTIVNKFSAWATNATASGKAMQWMNNSVEGVKSLWTGLDQAVKATWTLLTLFKTNTGENFLSRFAAEMTKFNTTVTNSASGGFLKRIGDDVRALGTDKIRVLGDLIKQALPYIKSLFDMLSKAGQVMGAVMTPAIQGLVATVGTLIQVFNNLGGGQILGAVLGIVGAFKIWGMVFSPIMNGIKIISGLMMGWTGLQNVVLGVAGTLEKFGSVGKAASNKVMGMGDAVVNFASKAGIIGAAIGLVVLGITGAQQKITDFNNTLKEGEKAQETFGEHLRSAFSADLALPGKNVFSAVNDGVTDMRANLEKQASQVPGVIDHLKELWFGGSGAGSAFGAGHGPFSWAEGADFNRMQDAAESAKKASDAFDRLKLTNQDLANIV
ncbi:MAG TPA: hypothetical protein VGE97_04830, partial [Nitrososphaera sp.]